MLRLDQCLLKSLVTLQLPLHITPYLNLLVESVPILARLLRLCDSSTFDALSGPDIADITCPLRLGLDPSTSSVHFPSATTCTFYTSIRLGVLARSDCATLYSSRQPVHLNTKMMKTYCSPFQVAHLPRSLRHRAAEQ